MVAALVGGVVGSLLPIPLGTLLGALVAATAVKLGGDGDAPPPAWLRVAVQILLGCLVGSALGPALLDPAALLPALLITVAGVLTWVAGSLLVARFGRVDLATALFVSAPGSPAETTAVAADANFRVELIAAVQLGRVLGVLLVAALLARHL